MMKAPLHVSGCSKTAAVIALGALLACLAWLPVAARAEPASPSCRALAEFTRLDQPLARLAHRIELRKPITIVALGSSSTAGAGASSPASSYPSQLEDQLKQRFPGLGIKVINRGVNGEEAAEMLARLDRDVIAENPDLVLWQIGTNAVLHDRGVAATATLIQEGLARIKASGADTVMIDLQYAPQVIARPDAERMVDLLSEIAKRANVDLFRRFAIMRYWSTVEKIPFDQMVAPDGIHMNDWSYGCLAKTLAAAIADGATRPALTAHAHATRL